jgi:hypothetical protein
MADSRAIVRDFIYLDIDKLYSLYSQLFEGVVDQIVQSFAEGDSTGNTQKGPPLSGKSLDSRVAATSVRTENKILYDHMYHRLEQRISASLVSGNGLSAENIRGKLGSSFLVKATGSAEIEDYSRMEAFLKKFNEIAEAIAYSAIVKIDLGAVKEAEAKIEGIGDRNKRKVAQEKLKKLSRDKLAKDFAASQGLLQDPKMLENMILLISSFHGKAYEVTIVPPDSVGALAFRGVLDKRWLRVDPDQLNALYGGFAEAEWTIVGHVTHLPAEVMPPVVQTPAAAAGTESFTEAAAPAMRDPYRNMFRASRGFERMFMESNERTEIVVSPIAIYRAMEVVISAD